MPRSNKRQGQSGRRGNPQGYGSRSGGFEQTGTGYRYDDQQRREHQERATINDPIDNSSRARGSAQKRAARCRPFFKSSESRKETPIPTTNPFLAADSGAQV